MEIDPFVFRLSIFILSIFIGYFVVWSVRPLLHAPLMSVTNAISSVIIVGAIVASFGSVSVNEISLSNILGFTLLSSLASFSGHALFAIFFSSKPAARIYLSLYRPVNAVVGVGFCLYGFKLLISVTG